jgi:hypothetical protein
MLTRRHWVIVLCVAALLAIALAPLSGQPVVVAALVLLPPLFGLARVARAVIPPAEPLPTFVRSAPLPFRGPPRR